MRTYIVYSYGIQYCYEYPLDDVHTYVHANTDVWTIPLTPVESSGMASCATRSENRLESMTDLCSVAVFKGSAPLMLTATYSEQA